MSNFWGAVHILTQPLFAVKGVAIRGKGCSHLEMGL